MNQPRTDGVPAGVRAATRDQDTRRANRPASPPTIPELFAAFSVALGDRLQRAEVKTALSLRNGPIDDEYAVPFPPLAQAGVD